MKPTSFELSDDFSKLPQPCREFVSPKDRTIGAKIRDYRKCCFVFII